MVGAGIASIAPLATDRLGLEEQIVSLADSVFEGDVSTARTVVTGFFGLLAAGMLYLAIYGNVGGQQGVMFVSVGVALATMAGLAFIEG